MDSLVYDIYLSWQESGELSLQEARMVEENLVDFLDSQLREVEVRIDQGDPYTAFGQFTQITSFLNQATNRVPRILNKLSSSVQRMGNALNNLAQQLGANGYSIGVAIPMGLSFDLSFPLQSAPTPTP